MEPLTALSLAGNIIQFVEFSSKLLGQGYELYRSTGGKLEVDEEVELITSDLTGLIIKIQYSTKQIALRTTLPTNVHNSNPEPPVFEKICDEATKIAQEILLKLEVLKIDETKNRKLETFKRVWNRLWSKGEIDELVGRLSRLKDVINTEALAAILGNTNELNIRTLTRFDSLDQQTQLILTSLLDSNQAATREVMAAIAQIMGRLEMFDRKDNNRLTREMIMRRRGNDRNLPSIDSIAASFEILAVPKSEEKALRADIQKTILESLSYPAMPKRYEQVTDAHPRTFDWAFQDSTDGKNRWANLASWLKSGSGLYWVSGKPGSGKSTLMKYICDDDRTRFFLEKWAQIGESKPVPLLIGTFFFWTSGTFEQRSQIGMLRALLFQILEQNPELLAVVFPSLWAKQYEKRASGEASVLPGNWTLRNLMAAFRRLINQRLINTKIFFLIDGLDEFEGDHEVLAELFKDVVKGSGSASNDRVKCCVSSRPWVVFKENFEGCPMLQLQDLTVGDIETFVTEKTLANSAFQRLAKQEPEATSELLHEIVTKAEGVFLWVRVVVIDLLSGMRGRDSVPDLWRRLQALPSDLDSLYRHIMSQIPPVHLVWASKVFQIAKAAREIRVPAEVIRGQHVNKELRGTITIGELYLSLDEDMTEVAVGTMSQEALNNKCRDIEYHITARCACLLEVIKAADESDTTSSAPVEYLHRTAKDFLEDTHRWNAILHRTQGTAFDPYYCMMRCNSLMLHWISNQMNDCGARKARIRNTLILFLAFASEADANVASNLQQKKMLDTANNLIASQDIDLANLHFTRRTIAAPIDMKAITACALGLNLSQYVAAELRRISMGEPEVSKVASTHMLSDRIAGDERNVNRSTDGSPYINMRMASVLVRFGADLNHKNNGSSVWEVFLVQGFRILSIEPYSCNPDFAKLMSLFLSAGANPHVSLKQGNTRMKLLEFFQTYIEPNFGSEADCLHDEIIQALKSPPPPIQVENQKSRTSKSAGSKNGLERFSTEEQSQAKSTNQFASPVQDDDTLHSHSRSANDAPIIPPPEIEPKAKQNESRPLHIAIEIKPQKRRWWRKGALASLKNR